VLKGYPYGLVPRQSQLNELTKELERLWEDHSDGVSVIRADWFAFAASRGDNYHSLLGLPGTIQELEKQLGIDRRRDFAEDRVRRAGFAGGGVSRHNRLIDRNRSPTAGYYYRSFDFGRAGGRSNLYTF